MLSGVTVFPLFFDSVEHLSGDGDSVLEQLFGIFHPDWFHRLGHESAKSWCDFIYKQTGGLCGHFGLSSCG